MSLIERNGGFISTDVALCVNPPESGTLRLDQGVFSLSVTSSTLLVAPPGFAVGSTIILTAVAKRGFQFVNFTAPNGLVFTQNPLSYVVRQPVLEFTCEQDSLCPQNDPCVQVIHANFVALSVIPTEIHGFSVLPTNIVVGNKISVSGALIGLDNNTGVGGNSVSVLVNNQNALTALTNTDGSFAGQLSFNMPGTYVIMAHFGGS